MARSIDSAMAADRPAKKTVRGKWADKVQEKLAGLQLEISPLYLTLPGAEGKEIELLIERGVLRRNATGSIRDEDGRKVVAIEYDEEAELALRKKFPGLSVRKVKIEELLQTTSPFEWPTEEDRWICRALVVNLDLNGALKCVWEAGQTVFPIVQLVSKLAELHAATPTVWQWTLCLTLNANVTWDANSERRIQRFLNENFIRSGDFATKARVVLGDALFADVAADTPVDWSKRSITERQRFLMTLVPKKIAHTLHTKGWRVDTVLNHYYGGEPGVAAMVTWIMDMHWDLRVSETPSLVYEDALVRVLHAAGFIRRDGTIKPL